MVAGEFSDYAAASIVVRDARGAISYKYCHYAVHEMFRQSRPMQDCETWGMTIYTNEMFSCTDSTNELIVLRLLQQAQSQLIEAHLLHELLQQRQRVQYWSKRNTRTRHCKLRNPAATRSGLSISDGPQRRRGEEEEEEEQYRHCGMIRGRASAGCVAYIVPHGILKGTSVRRRLQLATSCGSTRPSASA
jgi:hypothetical protein